MASTDDPQAINKPPSTFPRKVPWGLDLGLRDARYHNILCFQGLTAALWKRTFRRSDDDRRARRKGSTDVRKGWPNRPKASQKVVETEEPGSYDGSPQKQASTSLGGRSKRRLNRRQGPAAAGQGIDRPSGKASAARNRGEVGTTGRYSPPDDRARNADPIPPARRRPPRGRNRSTPRQRDLGPPGHPRRPPARRHRRAARPLRGTRAAMPPLPERRRTHAANRNQDTAPKP